MNGPLTAHRQRRRRITPNTNTTTTTMISTHNHVDMAASLVGAGQFAVTLLPATRASNSVMARRPTRRSGLTGWLPARPRPGQAMSTAIRVPETHELEGDDALNALQRTGRGRLG